MPTYEYKCPDGHEFERFYRKISDASPQVKCPECGKVAERKMSVGGGLLFKGSGFYLTDYGKNAHRGTAPTKSEGSSEGGAKDAAPAKAEGAGKSESKPAESTPAPKPAEAKAEPKTVKPKTDK